MIFNCIVCAYRPLFFACEGPRAAGASARIENANGIVCSCRVMRTSVFRMRRTRCCRYGSLQAVCVRPVLSCSSSAVRCMHSLSVALNQFLCIMFSRIMDGLGSCTLPTHVFLVFFPLPAAPAGVPVRQGQLCGRRSADQQRVPGQSAHGAVPRAAGQTAQRHRAAHPVRMAFLGVAQHAFCCCWLDMLVYHG